MSLYSFPANGAPWAKASQPLIRILCTDDSHDLNDAVCYSVVHAIGTTHAAPVAIAYLCYWM